MREKHECVKNPTVGSSMPSNSFLREDEDGIVRGFPQALYKEKGFVGWDDSLKEFDILIDMNSDIKYHFLTNSKEDKRTDEVSFAESLMHEINHGLGFASSISDYGYGFPTPAPSNEAIPVFYEFYFDKFLYVRETQLIKYTNYLNYYFQHHPRLSKSTDSLSRVEALKNFYKISSTPGILKFIAPNGQRITLDTTNTSPKGASVSHLDDNYTNTRDFMMVSVARVEQLSSFNFSDSAWKFKPYGENTILILKTLGYTFKAPDQTNPISKYFNPVSINPRPKRTISKSYRLRPKSKRTISKSYQLRPKSKRPKKYRKVKVRFIRRKRLG
ncbi:hypothetical protein L0F63_006739 [Massospora cicadina]|nr:hypothetical protein L0F63_006739 [Massospora cicadina]